MPDGTAAAGDEARRRRGTTGRGWERRVAGGLVVFAIYVGTARFGLSFDALAGIATTVWPPTGIALAAVFLGGRWLALAVFAAAWVTNLWAGMSWWTSLLIATGNTLEAIIGAALLSRWQFRRELDRVRDVGTLTLVAVVSTAVSASTGTTAVWLAGAPVPDGYALFWLVWWVGDVLGALLVAPAILTWVSSLRLTPKDGRLVLRWIEAAALLAVLVVVTLMVFGDLFDSRVVRLMRGSYSTWPVLLWAALRFGPRGTTAALLVTTVLVIGGTTSGLGVFAADSLHERLFRAQCYMAVTAVNMLVFAASFAERRQAVRARDEFISIASHELKTPLTALGLRMAVLQKLVAADRDAPVSSPASAPSPASASGRDRSGRVGDTVRAASSVLNRLVALTDGLLDVSRVTAGRLVLDRLSVDLGELVREVLDRMSEDVARSGARFDVDVPVGLVGTWDRVRLEQVLTNLFSNALKYGDGHPVSVSARARGDSVELEVRDQGTGISAADQQRIFGAFERVASDRRIGGLGLGLYIGRQIAEAHGGTLQVASKPGHGASFRLSLPLR